MAFVAFSPVLAWNASHNWISFAKQFGRLADQYAGLSYFGEFVAGQFGLLNPLIAIFATLTIYRWLRAPNLKPSQPIAFLVLLNGPLVIYMIFHALHDRVHANWPGPAYPAIAILAATAAVRIHDRKHLRRLSYWVAPVGIGLSCLLLFYFATPWGETFPLHSPADTLLGWHEFAEQLETMRENSGADWLATTDYGLTGELAFELGNGSPVVQIVDRQRFTFETPDPLLVDKPALLVCRLLRLIFSTRQPVTPGRKPRHPELHHRHGSGCTGKFAVGRLPFEAVVASLTPRCRSLCQPRR